MCPKICENSGGIHTDISCLHNKKDITPSKAYKGKVEKCSCISNNNKNVIRDDIFYIHLCLKLYYYLRTNFETAC